MGEAITSPHGVGGYTTQQLLHDERSINMPKLVKTPEGDLIVDDDYLDLSKNPSFRELVRSSLNPDGLQERKILTCEICGLNNSLDPWDVSYCNVTKQHLCEKHDDEVRAAAKQKKREETTQGILGNLDGHVTKLLAKSGMRPLELSSSVEKIPTTIACALAEHAPGVVDALTAGEYPKKGAALVGVARIGKTLAFAALMRESFRAYVLRAARVVDSADDLERRGFTFCHWPHLCAAWRLDWEGTKSSRIRCIQELSTNKFVFIDDLGREGLSAGRTYIDDPCFLLLNDIVSERHAYGRPLIWTANLAPDVLNKLYGAAMFERLVDLAPPIEIKGAAPITVGEHPVV